MCRRFNSCQHHHTERGLDFESSFRMVVPALLKQRFIPPAPLLGGRGKGFPRTASPFPFCRPSASGSAKRERKRHFCSRAGLFICFWLKKSLFAPAQALFCRFWLKMSSFAPDGLPRPPPFSKRSVQSYAVKRLFYVQIVVK